MGIWDETGMTGIMPSAFDVGEEVLARSAARMELRVERSELLTPDS
jgi:hypothetical protein